MDINIRTLEKYSIKNGYQFITNVNLSDVQPYLAFVAGDNPEGSLRVNLTFRDLNDILTVNKVLGEDGSLKKDLEEFHNATKKSEAILNRMDTSIYNVLSKYIIEILTAATGLRVFPEIIPLPMHKEVFFHIHD